jgi:hypothetical protein
MKWQTEKIIESIGKWIVAQNNCQTSDSSCQHDWATVIAGDLLRSHLATRTIMEDIAELLSPPTEEIKERDAHFVRVVLGEIAKGRRVILFIGEGHSGSISEGLERNGVSVSTVKTKWDFNTREVTLEEKVLGITERDPDLEILNEFLKTVGQNASSQNSSWLSSAWARFKEKGHKLVGNSCRILGIK